MPSSSRVIMSYPATVTLAGQDMRVDGRPLKMWGLRAASATQSDVLTAKLIAAIDAWSGTKLNCVSVFYQGSSGGNSRAWNGAGTAFETGQAERMRLIASECRRRGIVLIAGLFYQSATTLTNFAAYESATRLAAQSLAPYRNVIINIANEANSSGWAGSPFDPRVAANIGSACGWVHAEDPARVAGGGGYDLVVNKAIGAQSQVDVVLYDTINTTTTAGIYDDLLVTNANGAAVTNKPAINVETFGGSTGDITTIRGEYTAAWFTRYRNDIDEVKARNTGLLFHDNRWTQPLSRPALVGGPYAQDDAEFRFALGGDGLGQGTAASPGWRWWSDYIE